MKDVKKIFKFSGIIYNCIKNTKMGLDFYPNFCTNFSLKKNESEIKITQVSGYLFINDITRFVRIIFREILNQFILPDGNKCIWILN